jgi:hypothetical protein
MKGDALPADQAGLQKLKAKLAGLSVPTLPLSVAGAAPASVFGKKYTFPANEQKLEMLGVEFSKSANKMTLTTQSKGGKEQTLICGDAAWQKGRFGYGPFPEQEAAVCGSWTAKDVFTVKMCFYETPFILTLTMKFNDSTLTLDTQRNVGFGSTKLKQLIGKSE